MTELSPKDCGRALPQTPKAAHDAVMHTCPTCGAPAASEQIRTHDGVATADLLCPNGHIWRTTWVQEDV